MTLADTAVSVGTVALSVLGSWGIALHVGKRDRLSSVQAEAVDHLLPAVARILGLLHASSVRTLEPVEVGRAVVDFEELCLQHDAVLPNRVRPVRREVRAAVGNYFGAVSFVAVAAEFQEHPLGEPDAYWQDISISYVEYVLGDLKESAASPKGRRMISFHEWRRDEDDDYRASLKSSLRSPPFASQEGTAPTEPERFNVTPQALHSVAGGLARRWVSASQGSNASGALTRSALPHRLTRSSK